MSFPTIDHRGPVFAEITKRVLDRIRGIFKTTQPVIIFPGSGTGAWEAAIVNTLNPYDKVLMFETGQFSSLWAEQAKKFNLEVELVPGDWRTGADPKTSHIKLKLYLLCTMKHQQALQVILQKFDKQWIVQNTPHY